MKKAPLPKLSQNNYFGEHKKNSFLHGSNQINSQSSTKKEKVSPAVDYLKTVKQALPRQKGIKTSLQSR